jgi:hypothetical protein
VKDRKASGLMFGWRALGSGHSRLSPTRGG